MKSYFVLGMSNVFPECNVTRNFEKFSDAYDHVKNLSAELNAKFGARIREKNNGHLIEVILNHTKITFQLYKYIHEAPIVMYNR